MIVQGQCVWFILLPFGLSFLRPNRIIELHSPSITRSWKRRSDLIPIFCISHASTTKAFLDRDSINAQWDFFLDKTHRVESFFITLKYYLSYNLCYCLIRGFPASLFGGSLMIILMYYMVYLWISFCSLRWWGYLTSIICKRRWQFGVDSLMHWSGFSLWRSFYDGPTMIQFVGQQWYFINVPILILPQRVEKILNWSSNIDIISKGGKDNSLKFQHWYFLWGRKRYFLEVKPLILPLREARIFYWSSSIDISSEV